LSIGRWQVVAGRRLEGRRVAHAEGRSAAVAGPAHWREVLVGGAAVGGRLRGGSIAGMAGGYLVRGDRCNETNAETFGKYGSQLQTEKPTEQVVGENESCRPGSLHAACSDLAIVSAAKSELLAGSCLFRFGQVRSYWLLGGLIVMHLVQQMDYVSERQYVLISRPNAQWHMH